VFGEDMPDEGDFDLFDATPQGPGKGKKKGQTSTAGKKYQHEGGQEDEQDTEHEGGVFTPRSDHYGSEEYTGASGEGDSYDF